MMTVDGSTARDDSCKINESSLRSVGWRYERYGRNAFNRQIKIRVGILNEAGDSALLISTSHGQVPRTSRYEVVLCPLPNIPKSLSREQHTYLYMKHYNTMQREREREKDVDNVKKKSIYKR
eukprot:scaffold4489_cov165-Amphora_coffeaeformis.AAC.6